MLPPKDQREMLMPQDQEELLSDFVAESLELLAATEERLVTLEQQPHQVDLVRELMRSFHTIKGNSGYFGLQDISELAHRLETLLVPIQQSGGIFDEVTFAELLSGVDRLRQLVQNAAARLGGQAQDSAATGVLAEEETSTDRRYLVFRVGVLDMGLPLSQIQEVTRPTPVTRLPHVPPHVAGVVNLRGMVIPVVDLECRLWGTPGREHIRHLVVVPWQRGRVALGVSQVLAVTELTEDETSGTGTNSWYEGRVVFYRGSPVALLDVERILGDSAPSGGWLQAV